MSTLPKKSSSARRSRDSQFSLGLELPLLGSVNAAALHVASRNVNTLHAIGDVLVAVGAISANVGGTSLGLGGECYGTITAVGQEKPVA